MEIYWKGRARGGTIWEFCPNWPKRIPAEGRPGWWALPGGWRELGLTGYRGWEVLVKLAEKDSCWNWAMQEALESGLDFEGFQGILRLLGQRQELRYALSCSSWKSKLVVFSSLPSLPIAHSPPACSRVSSRIPFLTTSVLLQKYHSVDFKGLLCMSHELMQFFIVINIDGKTASEYFKIPLTVVKCAVTPPPPAAIVWYEQLLFS